MRFAERRKITTTATGTGWLSLGPSLNVPVGYGSIDVVAGYCMPYLLLDADGVSWESGALAVEYLSVDAVWRARREWVIESTNGNNPINLSSGEHTITLGVPSFMDSRPSGQVFTTSNTAMPDGVWTEVDWTGGSHIEQVISLWDASRPTHLQVPMWAEEVRISGGVAVSATAGGAGVWSVRIRRGTYLVTTSTPVAGEVVVADAQFNKAGSTTDIVTVPFCVRDIIDGISPTNIYDYRYRVEVLRNGVAGAVHSALTFADIEVLR